jgi:bacteriocin biosynthesis cyclodehydratase domain-containing protein
MRPILLPGTHVLRRDADTLQVGLDPAERILLRDTPRHRRLVVQPPVGESLALLEGALLPDDRDLRASLPPADDDDPDSVWARHSLASRARQQASQRGARLVAEDTIVLVRAYGAAPAEQLAGDVRRLVRRTGLPAPSQRRSGPRREPAPRELHVVVAVGEPPREPLDRLVDAGFPHVLLRFVEGRAIVGPLVTPRVTACVRCLDLHRTENDRGWPLLLEQYTRLSRHDRVDGVPEPVDAATAAAAAAWVVRDAAAYLTGGSPITWSSTLTMSPDLVELVLQEWPQRPDCACVSH